MMQIGLGVPMVAFLSRKPFWVDSSTIERWPQIEDNFLLQNWCECNQAPYDDPFFCDLLKEWKLSGSMFDFNEGIARMAFSYSAQVRKERYTVVHLLVSDIFLKFEFAMTHWANTV